MQDNFDKKLVERIVQVFDEYEDDSVDQGWEQLREKYPLPQRRSPLLYWLGSAAAILLLIAGVWLFYPEQEKIQIAARQKPQEATQARPEEAAGSAGPKIEDTGAQQPSFEEPSKRFESAMASPHYASSAKPSKEISSANHLVKEQPASASAATLTAPDSAVVSTVDVIIAAAEPKEAPANTAPAAPGDVRKPHSPAVVESYDQLQQAKRDLLANRSEESKEKRKDSKVSFSLYAGSHVSYAEGSKSRVNTGVGLSSEVDLTSKLKITTGVSIAQNSLRYDTRIPQQAAVSFLSSAMSNSPNLMVASPDAKTSAINYSIHGYDASLLGLDIPLNLKYTFFEKRNELYLVAGLSSNFFFDETYTYDYGYNSIHDSSVESFPDEKATTNSSSFDFARMLNLSVGYGYPIGKQSKLSLEPFLKYPLGGLGSQDIRFSSAGLNVKWNFGSR